MSDSEERGNSKKEIRRRERRFNIPRVDLVNAHACATDVRREGSAGVCEEGDKRHSGVGSSAIESRSCSFLCCMIAHAEIFSSS